MKQALFSAHFTHLRDLSDVSVLVDISSETGLDRTEALEVLEGQKFASEVRQMQNFWIQKGIRGVPAIVFDRQHLVSGAQGVENFTRILNQLAETSD